MPYHFKKIVASRYLVKKIISLNEVTNISNDKSVAVEYYLLIEDACNSWMIKTNANGNHGWKSLRRMFFLNKLRGFTKFSHVMKFSPECCFYSTFLFLLVFF